MNSRVAGLRVASVVFGIMFLGQLMRLIMRLNVRIGSCELPLWASGIAVVALGALVVWLWWLSIEPQKAAVDGGSTPA